MKKLIVCGLILWLLTPVVMALTPFTISDIRIEGLERISDGTVFSYLPPEVGDSLDQDQATDAMRALFRTGFFEDIVFEQQGTILVIRVLERPAISEIEINGNKDIKTEDLEKALQDFDMSEGDVFQRITLDRIQQSLTREYNNRGKYNVTIEPKVEELQRNRVKISLEIDEGKAARIKHINIVGNQAFSDEEIREEFDSSTKSFLSWYTKDDQYSKEKLEGDLEVLTSFYKDRGYLDFEIESTQVSISPDKQDVFITANIREGDIYTISEIRLAGEFVVPEASLRRLVTLKDGDIFSQKKLEASTSNISQSLANVGYAFANVIPDFQINKNDQTATVTLFIDPRKRVYVRRINFFGNIKTKDEVLRRELRQFEGGWFSQIALDRSKLRLQRLSYIGNVSIDTPEVPGSDDQVDINLTIEETTTGTFTFGFGYSQLSGLITSLALNQDNFLGSGKLLGVTVSKSSFFEQFSLSYTDPYWTDDGVSRGFNLTARTLNQGEANIASFIADTVSASVSFGIPVTEVDRFRLLIGAESTEITPFGGSGDEIRDELEFYGDDFTTYRSELTWTRDTRNRFFNPSNGSRQRASLELALPGSTAEFYKLQYDSSIFLPLSRNLTLALSSNLGYGDIYGSEDSGFGLPFFEHFFGGGVRDVRGFDDNTLGPRTSFSAEDPDTGVVTTVEGRPFGGDLKVSGGAELIFPIPFAKESRNTRLSWFVDFGQVYSDLDDFDAGRIRYSTGLSLRWQAPVGPVIINLVKVLNEEIGDDTETIQFAFGDFF